MGLLSFLCRNNNNNKNERDNHHLLPTNDLVFLALKRRQQNPFSFLVASSQSLYSCFCDSMSMKGVFKIGVRRHITQSDSMSL